VEDTLVYRTDENCWKCGRPLVRLSPGRDGWDYYCPYCEMLTLTRAEAAHALANVEEGATGVVVAVQAKLGIVWDNGKQP